MEAESIPSLSPLIQSADQWGELLLLLRLALPSLVPPEWALLMVVGLLFLWGFSSRYPSVDPGEITP